MKTRTLEKADYDRMCLPLEFQSASIAECPISVRGKIQNYSKNIDYMFRNSFGLLLYGAAGVGKTSVAAILLKELRARYRTGFFVTVTELRNAVRHNSNFDSNESVFSRCRSVDALVLDDLSERDAEEKYYFTAKDLTDLAKYRRGYGRITFVTTCLSIDALSSRFSDFCVATQGYLTRLEVTGEDRREVRAREAEAIIDSAGKEE